jgi:hypothetical protein
MVTSAGRASIRRVERTFRCETLHFYQWGAGRKRSAGRRGGEAIEEAIEDP